MKKCFLLEISVESVAAAVAAERGGADRIELCADAAIGGVTPSVEMMRETRQRVKIPIFAMIRPRGGNFVYSDEEIAAMRQSLDDARVLGMDGAVLGILTAERRVDVKRTRELVEHTHGIPVTYHRAIDESGNLLAALEEIVETGAQRILTSGGQATALAGAETIARLVQNAGDRVVILPGAGINPENAREVLRKTAARELHSGLSSVLGRNFDPEQFAEEVRKLREQIDA